MPSAIRIRILLRPLWIIIVMTWPQRNTLKKCLIWVNALWKVLASWRFRRSWPQQSKVARQVLQQGNLRNPVCTPKQCYTVCARFLVIVSFEIGQLGRSLLFQTRNSARSRHCLPVPISSSWIRKFRISKFFPIFYGRGPFGPVRCQPAASDRSGAAVSSVF